MWAAEGQERVQEQAGEGISTPRPRPPSLNGGRPGGLLASRPGGKVLTCTQAEPAGKPHSENLFSSSPTRPARNTNREADPRAASRPEGALGQGIVPIRHRNCQFVVVPVEHLLDQSAGQCCVDVASGQVAGSQHPVTVVETDRD